MFEEITYYQVLGIPLIIHGGLLALLSLFITSGIMILNSRKITRIPFKWHHRMAIITLILGIFHGLMAILAYF